MNPFSDEFPEIPACPRCGHTGDGLQWSFPEASWMRSFHLVQCACLACGAHGIPRWTYEDAAASFKAVELEE